MRSKTKTPSGHLSPGVVQLVVALLGGMVAVQAQEAPAPTIFWASTPVNPDETAVLMGDGFGTGAAVEARPAAANGPWQKLPPIQASDTNLKFVIPANWPKGAYACRVVNGGRTSAETVLNTPDLWWAQGNLGNGHATPGGELRFFGKCLNFGGQSRVRLQTAGKTVAVFPVIQSSPYALTVKLPETMAPADYTLAVNNGYGGDTLWSEPLPLQVSAPPLWKTDIFDVSAFRVKTANDTAAIKAAIAAAAANGGGVVYFPRGNYSLTETLEIPRFVTLRGVGMALVNLQWADSPQPLPALLHGTDSFAVEELCLYANNHMHGIEANRGQEPNAGNVRIHHVRLRLDRYLGVTSRRFDKDWKSEARRREDEPGRVAAIQLGGDNIEISDCDIYISPLYDFETAFSLVIDRVRGGRITGNRIYSGYRNTCIIRGVDGLVFENNDMQGGCFIGTHHTQAGRFGGQGAYINSTCQNIYFAGNKIHDNMWWDRELVTFDSQQPAGVYLGRITQAAGTALTLASTPPDPAWERRWKGAGVYILDGKGAGQYRRLVTGDGATVQVDRPWDVPPDVTSRISIAKFHGRVLLVGNDFADGGNIMWWGGGIDCIMAQNTARRVGSFLTITGWIYEALIPNWYCQFLDNDIQEGGGSWGGSSKYGTVTETYPLGTSGYDGPVSRCGIHRRNRSENSAFIDVSGGAQDVLVEACRLAEADTGITVTMRGPMKPSGVVLRHNQFVNVKKTFSGAALESALVLP